MRDTADDINELSINFFRVWQVLKLCCVKGKFLEKKRKNESSYVVDFD